MRILFIGDIVGKPGRRAIKELLPGFIEKYKIDFTIANGENLANGAGLTEKTAKEMFNAGVDLLTGGNHSFHKHEGLEFIEKCEKILRPLNMGRNLPGRGYGSFEVKGQKIFVLNLIGQVFMGTYESPFYATWDLMPEIEKYKIKIVDFHAEATAEKLAFLYTFKGVFSAILGTHTHVQTADARIVEGTAYITDVGMTGGLNGIIGVDKELYIKKFVYRLPTRFKPEKEGIGIQGVIVEIEEGSGKAITIEPFTHHLEPAGN